MDIGEARQKADELTAKLAELVDSLQELLGSPETATKRKQLRAICESIGRLQRSGVPVPDDFRRIKTDLTGCVAVAEQADELKSRLIAKLTEALRKLRAQPLSGNADRRPPRGAGEGRTRRVSVADLIEAGLIKDGARIVHRGKRGKNPPTFFGVLRSPGQIELEADGRKQVFNNPSAAAVAFIGGTCNGWDWWFAILDDGREVPLSLLRSRLTRR